MLRHSILWFPVAISLSLSCTQPTANSQAKHLGYYSDASLGLSIGAFTPQEALDGTYVFAYGTGFIIGETDTSYIGLTNAHVWEQCQAITKDGSCLLAFATNKEQNAYWHYRAQIVKNANGKPVIYYVNADAPGQDMLDFAVFSMDKIKDQALQVLPTFVGENPTNAFPITITGYPGGMIRQGEDDMRGTLVRSEGVAFRSGPSSSEAIAANGGRPVDVESTLLVFSHIRSGNSGSPVLSKTDKGWVVVGIASQGQNAQTKSVFVDSQKSAAKDSQSYLGRAFPLSSLYARTRDQSFWQSSRSTEKAVFAPVEDASRLIKDARYDSQTDDGDLLYRFSMTVDNSVDINSLFINGKAWKYMDAIVQGRALTFSLSATELFGNEYPDVVIEGTAAGKPMFAACYRNTYMVADLKVSCFERINNEYRYQSQRDE